MYKLCLVFSMLLLTAVTAFSATEAEIKTLETKAREGDVAAIIKLGDAYCEEGEKFYRRAADRGHAPAQYILGRLYYNEGDMVLDGVRYGAVTANNVLAKDYYGKAAAQGHAEAQKALALMLVKRAPYVPTPNELTEAAKWHALAVEQGHTKASFDEWLGLGAAAETPVSAGDSGVNDGVVVKTIVLPPNVNELKVKARNNNPEALYNLAGYYVEEGLKMYLKAAAYNNAAGQRKLAVLYAGGGLIAYDGKKALLWFEKAAENGDMIAQRAVGYYSVLDKNNVNAVKWYALAAKQGDVEAQYQLARLYMEDARLKDDDLAFKWLWSAANQGYVKAQYGLGEYYAAGGNYDESSKWFVKVASSNDPYYLYKIGEKYFEGRDGLKQDYQKSYQMFMQVAKITGGLGSETFIYADYYYLVGLSYYKGLGTGAYYSEALRWLTRAADMGGAQAAYHIGQIYRNGQGVRRSLETAVNWFEKAHELGDTEAAYALGQIYAVGEGVSKDDVKAVKWLAVAARQGNFEAMRWFMQNPTKPDLATILDLKAFFANRQDMPEQMVMSNQLLPDAAGAGNLEAALYLFSLAGRGDVNARYAIAKMYYEGNGLAQSQRLAWVWAHLALDKKAQGAEHVKLGNELKAFMAKMESGLSELERDAAVEEWRALGERLN